MGWSPPLLSRSSSHERGLVFAADSSLECDGVHADSTSAIFKYWRSIRKLFCLSCGGYIFDVSSIHQVQNKPISNKPPHSPWLHGEYHDFEEGRSTVPNWE